MTRVRITRNTVAARRSVMVGEVLDLPSDEASLLIAIGKAVEIKIVPQFDIEAEKLVEPPTSGKGLTTETAAALIKGKKPKKPKAPTGLSRMPFGTM